MRASAPRMRGAPRTPPRTVVLGRPLMASPARSRQRCAKAATRYCVAPSILRSCHVRAGRVWSRSGSSARSAPGSSPQVSGHRQQTFYARRSMPSTRQQGGYSRRCIHVGSRHPRRCPCARAYRSRGCPGASRTDVERTRRDRRRRRSRGGGREAVRVSSVVTDVLVANVGVTLRVEVDQR
jgi:hypothetical protein